MAVFQWVHSITACRPSGSTAMFSMVHCELWLSTHHTQLRAMASASPGDVGKSGGNTALCGGRRARLHFLHIRLIATFEPGLSQ